MAASIPCKEVIISHFVVLNYEIRQKYAYFLTMGLNGSQWTKLQKIYSGKNILKRPLCMSHLEWAVLKKNHFEIHILYENIFQFNSIKISRNLRLTFNLVSSYRKSSITCRLTSSDTLISFFPFQGCKFVHQLEIIT